MLPTSLSPSIGRLCDQLHAVQRIAQIGFWEMCAENSYLTLSDGTCAILGIKQNDFQHSFDAFLSFVHVSDQRGLLDALAKSRDGEPPDIEYRIVQPTGAVRYVHAHTALIRGNDGKISYFGTVQDITERVLRQHEAEQNALLLQIASRIAHMGGWKFEPATGRVAWSDEVCKIHEVPSGTSPTPEQAIAFYAPEWREKIRNWFDACLRNGIPYDEEVQIITANGRKVWVRTIGEPVRDADGTIICVQGALQDITEKRQGWEYAGRLLTTLDSISDAFYTLDRQWR
ncbi:MAG: hypothetical protein JWQ00_2386, partial [Noviherbaspirillum sp.]|nr:hypothetical protein [Noviherbaspirillum sp.]